MEVGSFVRMKAESAAFYKNKHREFSGKVGQVKNPLGFNPEKMNADHSFFVEYQDRFGTCSFPVFPCQFDDFELVGSGA